MMFDRFSDYKKLKAKPDTSRFAWPMLKSYLIYVIVYIVCFPYLLFISVFCWIIDLLDNFSYWLNQNACPKFLNKVRAEYKKNYKAGYDAYAPYRERGLRA